MTTRTTEPDLVEQVEELLAKDAPEPWRQEIRERNELLRRLVEEAKANRETLLALKNCQNKPVCGHCSALLRHATRNLDHA